MSGRWSIHNDQIALVIGDVMGHGVRASLIMTQIVGFLRSQSRSLSRPVQLVTTLNRMLIDLGGKVDSVLSCSLLYGLIDAPTGTGFFVNAGHPRPLVCRPGSVRSMHLGEPNILLGVEEFVPAEVCHTFDPGERLVMFTDGITDAANPDGERFGGARLVELASSHLAGDPDSCAEAVFRAVDEFRRGAGQMDDETVVVVDRI